MSFWLYDRYIYSEEGGLWLRGLQYSAAEMGDILYTLRDVFLVFSVCSDFCPAGRILAGGTLFASCHADQPYSEEIRQNGDLTKRIEIKDSGDEISALAGTFNGMFQKLAENFEAERKFSSNASMSFGRRLQ